MQRHAPLVSCETVFENLASPDWVIFDCRYHLGEPEKGLRDYGKNHIPGARYAHIDRDLSGPVGTGGKGRHPLPIEQAFVRFMGMYGVTPDTQIVAYDDAGGWWASRLWWLARHFGLKHVAVLDGGLTRWKALGLPQRAIHEAPPTASKLDLKPGLMPLITIDEVEKLVADGKLVDVRAPERYSGEQEPVDVQAGHIPGAINMPFARNVGPDMMFLSPDELRSIYEDRGQGEGTAVYCGSGVTATHSVLAMEVAEMPTPALFPGSWSEWCRKTANRPIATGSEPGALTPA